MPRGSEINEWHNLLFSLHRSRDETWADSEQGYLVGKKEIVKFRVTKITGLIQVPDLVNPNTVIAWRAIRAYLTAHIRRNSDSRIPP